VISGTLAYMAPEQTGRMNRSVDSRSDLYALGVTFYEMLAGQLPFAAADPMEWVHCHIAWRAVFENNPTMYFMLDAAGTIVSVNPFGAEQLGYTVDELIGCPVQNVFHEADRDAVRRNVACCFEQLGRTMSWEFRKLRKDGSVLWVRETARAMPIKDRPVALIVCEDVTERKRAEYLARQVSRVRPIAYPSSDRITVFNG
jgi:PAS domain S-box-containing protein